MPMGGCFKRVSCDPARLSSALGVCRRQIRPILAARLAGLEPALGDFDPILTGCRVVCSRWLAGLESACSPAVLDRNKNAYGRVF